MIFGYIIQGNASKETTFFGKDSIPYLYSSFASSIIICTAIGILLNYLAVHQTVYLAVQCAIIVLCIIFTLTYHRPVVETQDYRQGLAKGVKEEAAITCREMKMALWDNRHAVSGMFILFTASNAIFPAIIAQMPPASMDKAKWNNLNNFAGSIIFVVGSMFVPKKIATSLLSVIYVAFTGYSAFIVYAYWYLASTAESWYFVAIFGGIMLQGWVIGLMMTYLVARTAETKGDRVSLFIVNSGMNYGYLAGTSLAVLITIIKASV